VSIQLRDFSSGDFPFNSFSVSAGDFSDFLFWDFCFNKALNLIAFLLSNLFPTSFFVVVLLCPYTYAYTTVGQLKLQCIHPIPQILVCCILYGFIILSLITDYV
jgi:hypothetical protein